MVGAADDRAEIEADRVASEVIARLQGSEGSAHEHSPGCDHAPVRRSTAPSGGAEVGYEGGRLSADVSSRIEGKRGSGASLSADVRTRLEEGFGGSLADVRIHHDAESADLNRAVSARAFTAGKDIFFGQGEYRPDTPEGERVLAHEIAHTRQQGDRARRTIHRWDIGAKKIDWSQAVSVGTVSSGQMVYFMKDSTGHKLAVKKEAEAIGLQQLATVMHEKLSGVISVQHRALPAEEIATVVGKVNDPTALDRPDWERLGAETKANAKFAAQLEDELKLGEGGLAAMSDFEVGHAVHTAKLNPLPQKMVAMTFAEGETAGKTVKKNDPDQMKPEKNRMRALMSDFRHVQQLGQLTAVDLFLGNKDRVFFGNLGNWFYDPYTEAITAIDHVDMWAGVGFKGAEVINEELRTKNMAKTAKQAVGGLIGGIEEYGDPEFGAWVKEDGGYRRLMLDEAMERGLAEGRKLIIKTFTATRFSGSSKARAVKKAIKKAGREAIETDKPGSVNKDDYYQLLKRRVEWLKKN